jgi:hypothetical protein
MTSNLGFSLLFKVVFFLQSITSPESPLQLQSAALQISRPSCSGRKPKRCALQRITQRAHPCFSRRE